MHHFSAVASVPIYFLHIYQYMFCQQGLDGARVEKILDMASITLNKNSVPG
jgi:glycine/serine hydroxymethyltransferase